MPRKPKLENTQVLKAIELAVARYGRPPTIEELRAQLRVGSTRTVLRYLQKLEDAGTIERWPGARGMRVKKRSIGGLRTITIPIVGEAPAGPLIVAEENREGWIHLSSDRVKSGDHVFLLRVRGDSMNRASVHGKKIENGDLVLIRQQPDASDGAIVVALIDGQATIKRVRHGSDYVVLSPDSSNKNHRPFVVTDDLQIQGVVIDVLKRGERLIAEGE